jgi:glutamyl-tRNA synthetase
LLKKGYAYICTCPAETFRELKANSQPCPDRDKPIDVHLEHWRGMLDREYKPGEASLIVKTDLDHPNPAVRDFVAFRLVEQPHPVTQDKYYVYPTYNFSVAIDDHLMSMTHILRGKDHLNNTYRQKYIYKYLNWLEPEFLHYGWVTMDDVILKTTLIKEGIKSGKFKDWSDVQLGTLQALNRRGFKSEAIRKFWLDVGIKDVDITFSWQTLFSFNKNIIESESNRYFFVWDPVTLIITEVTESSGQSELIGHAPLHPDDPARGVREIKVQEEDVDGLGKKGIKILLTRSDLEGITSGTKLRLKDLCNVEVTRIDLENVTLAKYIGNDLEILKEGARIVHWVSASDNYPTKIYHPDGNVSEGYSETTVRDALNKMVQFERFGFVKLDASTQPVIGWFTHK